MDKQRILILYAAIGLGHKSIAENIAFQLEAAGFEVKLADAQRVQGGLLAKWGKLVYQWIIMSTPSLWDWFYKTEWFIRLTLPLRVRVAAKNYEQIIERVNEFKPTAVICTHTTASAILSYIKSKQLYHGKFIVAFSDFHLHRYWLYDNVDGYLINIEEQRQEMLRLNIPDEKIFVCGFTLKPKAEIDLAKTREKFGIAQADKVVLISSGSQGFGLDENLIQELSNRPQTKVIVLSGNNQRAHDRLLLQFYNKKTLILHYHKFMDELYAVSDIFVTKAGAMSVSEALLWQVPILVSHLLPGQELLNYQYLSEKGLVMPEPINLVNSVKEELDFGAFKNSLRKNEERLKLVFPNYAAKDAVIEMLDVS